MPQTPANSGGLRGTPGDSGGPRGTLVNSVESEGLQGGRPWRNAGLKSSNSTKPFLNQAFRRPFTGFKGNHDAQVPICTLVQGSLPGEPRGTPGNSGGLRGTPGKPKHSTGTHFNSIRSKKLKSTKVAQKGMSLTNIV